MSSKREKDEDCIELASELRRVMRAAHRQLRDNVPNDSGLTPIQASVLSYLEARGAQTNAELARHERIKPQSMVTAIAPLSERELVRRYADASDGRRVLIDVTEQGLAALNEFRAARNDWLGSRMAQRLTPAQRDMVAQSLAFLDQVVRD